MAATEVGKVKKPLGMRIGESVFCAGYLAFALAAGCIFLGRHGALPDAFYRLCAAMTFLLAGGDAFHLIPRIAANLGTHPESRFRLGLGNLVSSITMTFFYVVLLMAMRQTGAIPPAAYQAMLAAMVALALVRTGLCAAPGNRWFGDGGDMKWRALRNVPFALIGLITVGYLAALCRQPALAALVAASFACYMAVVLGVQRRPALGMLMMPKTLCYVGLIAILLGW